jgi:formylglycine-generating enzyme required for sulfatase activity
MSPPSPDVVPLDGGDFGMGSDQHYREEAPVRRVRVDPFSIDRYEVTNARFAEFVDATDYVTVAERPLDPADFPGAPPENLVPGSLVFTPTPGRVDLRHLSQWWTWTPGASWRAPEGPGSSVERLLQHPVVHIAHEDAASYAAWIGARLPSEAEWEFAARGGLDGAAFTWGDVARPDGRIMANTWDGPDFPWRSTGESGFLRTAPVGSFPPNGFGLHDMAGNVWEWTANEHTATHVSTPDRSGYDLRTIKGGGWDNLTTRLRVSERTALSRAGRHNLYVGFRCVKGPMSALRAQP